MPEIKKSSYIVEKALFIIESLYHKIDVIIAADKCFSLSLLKAFLTRKTQNAKNNRESTAVYVVYYNFTGKFQSKKLPKKSHLFGQTLDFSTLFDHKSLCIRQLTM